jgi:hypothetical protein
MTPMRVLVSCLACWLTVLVAPPAMAQEGRLANGIIHNVSKKLNVGWATRPRRLGARRHRHSYM